MRREIVEIVMRSQQRVAGRNHGLRYNHQLKAKSTGDVDQGRRARSTASVPYLAIAGTRYARHVCNLFLLSFVSLRVGFSNCPIPSKAFEADLAIRPPQPSSVN